MSALLRVLGLTLSVLFTGTTLGQSLSASPSTVYTGQSVTATWSGIGAPTSTDWIGLYPVGAPDNAFVAFAYTDGNASGSEPLTVPANTAAGTYELRLFSNNGYTNLATSNSFSIQTPSGSISASPATVFSGQPVTATWSAISSPTASDWIGLYPVGAPDNAFVAFEYTDGNASGSEPLEVPANTAPGSYELRLFSNNGYQRLGTSNSFSIQTPSGNISANPSSIYASQSVTATWSAISLPTASDWIGLYVVGSADNAFVSFEYTDGNASGSAPFPISGTAAAGTYELRLFSDNGYQRLGTSNSFTVQTPPPATLSVAPSSVPPGGQVTATWTSIFAPTATDWIGLYAPNAADNAFVAFVYTTGAAAGNVPFNIPANLAQGTYQMRLFSNNGYTRLATSNNFSVSTAKLSFIHVDHLNTPRLVADQNQATVWKWDQQEPFAADTPNGDPGNTGTTFDIPLRLPGQYADKETNTSYNYLRDYDPALGRYAQSDLIGLQGGLNTYAYVGGAPIGFIDPLGLFDDFPFSRPPSFFELTVVEAFRRDTSVAEAIGRGEGFRNVVAPAIMVPLSGNALGLVGESLVGGLPIAAAMCRAVPEALPKVAEACKNPILAVALGAAICGATSGTVKGTAREYARTRERIQELRDASERANRSTGTRQSVR